jgi:hypothetical protein
MTTTPVDPRPGVVVTIATTTPLSRKKSWEGRFGVSGSTHPEGLCVKILLT